MVLRQRKEVEKMNNSQGDAQSSSAKDTPMSLIKHPSCLWKGGSFVLLVVTSATLLHYLLSHDLRVRLGWPLTTFSDTKVPKVPVTTDKDRLQPSMLSKEETETEMMLSKEETETETMLPYDESSMVQVVPQVFLRPTLCDRYNITTHRPSNVSVTTVMTSSTQSKETERLFVMLNGQNEGVYVTWKSDWTCLYEAVHAATIALGADADWRTQGLRVMSPMGLALTTVDSIDAVERRVHVLFDNQLWQWPGIHIGYVYHLENHITLTTISLNPKVFDVMGFFSHAEAAAIISQGESRLNVSKSMKDGKARVSETRTSHTAFLHDNTLTRALRNRAATVTRLPSPGFVGRNQLVRYKAGEFYRKHMDTFHSRPAIKSRDWLYKDYTAWVTWANATITTLVKDRVLTLPDVFLPGGALFPTDSPAFEQALVSLFLPIADATHFWLTFSCVAWEATLKDGVAKNSTNLMEIMTQVSPKSYKFGGPSVLLPAMIREWERAVGNHAELKYRRSDKFTNGVTYYHHWITTVKADIAALGRSKVPASVQPGGEWYPRHNVPFQQKILALVLDSLSPGTLLRLFGHSWRDWAIINRKASQTLSKLLNQFPPLMDHIVPLWQAASQSAEVVPYTLPEYVQAPNTPQRTMTLFMYLNEVTEGGETVFPYALQAADHFPHVNRTGMEECAQGLAVPPLKLHASLFYTLTPEGEVDWYARHGGCPPERGIKYGSNLFMWNVDSKEGASAQMN